MIRRLFIVVFTITIASGMAQRNSSSPYSFFGIGEDVSRTTVEQASMGGIGVALKDYNHLNFTNPAANADLRMATYAIGGDVSLLKVESADSEQSGNTTSLRYIVLGVPIGKKAGFSAGLQPVSSIGYSLITEDAFDDDGDVTEATQFTGNGGTNRLFGSFGMNVIDGLAVGFEASFIFGTLENDLFNQRTDVALGTKYERDGTIRGGEIKFGAQYKKKLKKDLELNTGITIQLENELNLSGTERLYSFTFSGIGTEVGRDTLYNRALDGKLVNPFKTIIGVGIGKDNKWYAGIDYEFQGAFENQGNIIEGATYTFEDSNRLSIGGYYIPKINSISSYWDRVTYRAGLRFEDTGLLVDGTGDGTNFTSINDFGINVGFGLPMPRLLSSVNLGFEYGQKGTTDNNLIKESYFNLRLSLSLNSSNWFKKRRID